MRRKSAGQSDETESEDGRETRKPEPSVQGGAWWNGEAPSPEAAFALIVLFRGLGALYAPISDCDEVFNYWEPLHFSVYGLFSTWEYSPQFALRSWVYIFLHALNAAVFRFVYAEPLGALLRPLGAPPPKIVVFYLMRLSLVAVSALADANLYRAVARHLSPAGPRRARALTVLAFLCVSTGLVCNSCAFLPSTFAMYLTSFTFASLAELPARQGAAGSPQNYMHATRCIWFMVVGVLVGWPFVGLLALPIAGLLLFQVRLGLWPLVKSAVVAVLLVSLPMAVVESAVYGRMTLPPLNIVLYNVFAAAGDSTLYGTEPAWFYLANLVINFNAAAILSLLLPLVLLMKRFLQPELASSAAGLSDGYLLWWISPLYLWLAFFSAQAHKEERFMFVVYPLVAVAAGVALADAAALVGALLAALCKWRRGGSAHTRCVRALVYAGLGVAAAVNLARALTLVLGFSAPFRVWAHAGSVLPRYRRNWGLLQAPLTVCVGKEWYRFPGHLFVDPDGLGGDDGANSRVVWKLGFVKSEFDGQMPSLFATAPQGVGVLEALRYRLLAAQHVDPSFNSLNDEVMSRYVDVSECNFLIDRSSSEQTERRFDADTDTWEVLYTEPFLNAARSRFPWKTFYVPLMSHHLNHFDTYTLLRNRKSTRPK